MHANVATSNVFLTIPVLHDVEVLKFLTTKVLKAFSYSVFQIIGLR